MDSMRVICGSPRSLRRIGRIFVNEGRSTQDKERSVGAGKGQITALGKNALFDSVAEQVAKDAIVAYGMHSAMARHSGAMKELETALNDQFAASSPVIGYSINGTRSRTSLTEHDQTVVTTIKALLRDEHISPAGF